MLDLSDYEQIDPNTALATEFILRVYNKAGKPERLSTDGSWKVFDAIFGVWAKNYPEEHDDFRELLKARRANAKSVKKMVKEGHGVFTVSYPKHLLWMLRIMFPKEKFQNRDLIRKIAKRYPGLKNIDANV